MVDLRLVARATDLVDVAGRRTRELRVFCPPRMASIDVETCAACPHATCVDSEVVKCSPPSRAMSRGLELPAGAVPGANVTCARGEVTGEILVPLLPPEPWALPVADGRGMFLGFVSRAELAGLPRRLAMALPASALAVGETLLVHEAAPLRIALHTMAHRRARALALVDDSGTIRGTLTDLAALRAVRT
jgi:hypothetical protein